MAEQVFKARDDGQTFDVGRQDSGGLYTLHVSSQELYDLLTALNTAVDSADSANTDSLATLQAKANEIKIALDEIDNNTSTGGAVITSLDSFKSSLLAVIGDTVTTNTVRELLLRLNTAISNLSSVLSADLIQIDLNTDEIEAKLETVKTSIDSAETARDADATTAQARLDLLATETKLEAVRALLDAAEAARDSDATTAQARLDLLATESKLEALRAQLANAETARDSDATSAQARLDLLATEASLSSLLDKFTRELTERMLNKYPAEGYSLWFDTANASHIYTLEAPLAATSGDTGFRGVRVSLLLGFPVGKVEINTGGTLTFDNRTTDVGWA